MKAAATATTAVEPTATTAAMEAAASTTSAVEAAASATTVPTATALRERSRRAKQRHRSDCGEEKLKISGLFHGCYLHRATSQSVRAAGTPRPFYIN
jgi:hypothetical protein